MGESIMNLIPQLRRYAHALLGSWPPAPRVEGETAPQADQDADDLVHEALLGFWRAGLRQFRTPGEDDSHAPGEDLRLSLYRRVTTLARRHLMRKAGEILACGGRAGDDATPREPIRHFAWAPEARALPSLALDLRALLALVVLERLSYGQAGAVLDMPAERALTRLTVARAHLASGISGAARSHLIAISRQAEAEGTPDRAAGPVTERDLHQFVDDQLDETRRGEVIAFLESHPQITRRAAEWRRQSERLRRAFEPLIREPLPLSLDFTAPEARFRSRPRRSQARDGVFERLAAIFTSPSTPVHTAPRPF